MEISGCLRAAKSLETLVPNSTTCSATSNAFLATDSSYTPPLHVHILPTLCIIYTNPIEELKEKYDVDDRE